MVMEARPVDTAVPIRPRQCPVNGEANKLLPEDRPVHDWYRFVLSYPPHLVRDYLVRFGIGSDQQVLDPFCGTGTTLVECKKLGIPSVGVEAVPMAHFASRVKVDWSPDPEGLISHSEGVAGQASGLMEQSGLRENPILCMEAKRGYLQTRGLSLEQEQLLLTNSISPIPLKKTLILLNLLRQNRNPSYYDHQSLALAKALVYSISNLVFGPEVGVGEIKEDADVLAAWLTAVRGMADDLRIVGHRPSPDSIVHNADARQISDILEPNSIDAVITSPPYPNEKDYTRTTRLESVLLGFVDDKIQLRSLKKTLVRSNTRGVYKEDDDDKWVTHPEVERICKAIEARRIELGKTSGFERLYARVTKLYFGGMARHLMELQKALRPGAMLAYVVGDQASYLRVMIHTGEILGDIARSLGYELVGRDLFRTRLATATKEQLREEVVILRWPGQRIRGKG